MTERGKILTAANACTALRIPASVALIFLRPMSAAFYVLYTLCGVTDVLDGWLARRTGTACAFGAKLDTAADLLFYSVMMLRLLPEMIALLPVWIWYLVAFAVVLRLAGYAVVALRFHCFAAAHTWGSKLCGGTIFLIPYLLRTPAGTVYCVSTAVVAVLSATETLALHVLSTESRTDVRGLWQLAAARERPSEE